MSALVSPIHRTFAAAVDAAARLILAARPHGIWRNGSSLDATAERPGFQMVTATEVLRAVQDEASRVGRRWRNCDDHSVSSALRARGWTMLYRSRKKYLFLDAAEAARMDGAVDDAKEAKAAARARKKAKRAEVALACGGQVVSIFVKARPKGPMSFSSRQSDGREYVVPATQALDAASRFVEKASRIKIRYRGADWTEHAMMTWERYAPLQDRDGMRLEAES